MSRSHANVDTPAIIVARLSSKARPKESRFADSVRNKKAPQDCIRGILPSSVVFDIPNSPKRIHSPRSNIFVWIFHQRMVRSHFDNLPCVILIFISGIALANFTCAHTERVKFCDEFASITALRDADIRDYETNIRERRYHANHPPRR